jgi:hypothetical protein
LAANLEIGRSLQHACTSRRVKIIGRGRKGVTFRRAELRAYPNRHVKWL